jgi:hypothetical protein
MSETGEAATMWRVSGEVKPKCNRAVGAVAATVSVTALACGVCCVLPFAIAAAMLGSVGGIFAWFSHAYGWMAPVACAAVVAAWLWVGYQSRRSGKRPAKATLLVMGLATVMMGLGFMWPMFEGVAGY